MHEKQIDPGLQDVVDSVEDMNLDRETKKKMLEKYLADRGRTHEDIEQIINSVDFS